MRAWSHELQSGITHVRLLRNKEAHMHRTSRVGLGVLALTLFASGCYGPFNLTRRLYQWNGQVGTKWEREFMFILLAWAPVYGLAVLGDAVVFNSMEFWTGRNPVDAPGKSKSELPQTRRLARGEDEALLTYTEGPNGPDLVIQQFQQHRPAGTLRIERRDGIATGLDADGRVLFTAQSRPDGRVLVRDSKGEQIVLR